MGALDCTKCLVILARPAFRTRWQDPGNFYLYQAMQTRALVLEWNLLNFFRALITPKTIIHIHWPDNILRNSQSAIAGLRLFVFMCLTQVICFARKPLIWTAHNLQSHEQHHPRLERFFWWFLLRRIHAIIFHSRSLQKGFLLKHTYAKKVPSTVIPLSMFHNMYPRSRKKNIRELLMLPKNIKLCLFFGQIREYKNLPCLVTCFRRLPQDYHLVIAGSCKNKPLLCTIKTMINNDNRIHLMPHFVPMDDVSSFFAGADLTILPFLRVSNSGSALLSLSFSVPVLLPRVPQFKELQNEFGIRWVRLFTSLTPRSILVATKRKSISKLRVPPSRKVKYAAEKTFSFFSRFV